MGGQRLGRTLSPASVSVNTVVAPRLRPPAAARVPRLRSPVRPPVDTITPPPFPPKLPWVNVASLRMDQQRGRPVLVEFWDFCRVQSLRTLPYLQAWHERYGADGLRVVLVHSPG